MKTLNLDGVWRLFFEKDSNIDDKNQYTIATLEELGYKSIEANVPGNFELDFQRQGIIKELFLGTDVLKLQDFEDLHLWYCKTFFVDDSSKYTTIKFEGIDTIADIYLNGEKIGHSENMLITHEFNIENIKCGENQIVVHIKPVYLECRKNEIDAGCFSALPFNSESITVRKAAHMYGWDIMPRIISGGLWRSVYLCGYENYYIKDIYIYTASCNEENAEMMAFFSLNLGKENARKFKLKITGKCKESIFEIVHTPWHTQGNIEFRIESPELWWPKNIGDANLYNVVAELFYEDKKVDSYSLNLGIRTVTLKKSIVVESDKKGEFCFFVNNKPIFVMGTNWVPLDPLHSKDLKRLPKALELLDDIGCNMVRCWGGNVYESNEFFDFCDQKGILVWQDFAMGCATYPQDDDFCNKIENEVVNVVRRLRQHPCIAIWAGDNECDMFTAIRDAVKANPEMNRLTREIIPRTLYRLDPLREYLPSSPYIDKVAYEKGLGNSTPEQHLWGPRNYYKDDYYKNNNAIFASEIGTYCAPSPKSIAKFITEDSLWYWNNDEWRVHSSTMAVGNIRGYSFRVPYMENQNNILFADKIDNLDDFCLANQIFQAEAMKFFIELFRTNKWEKTGIIWWNLIDGWPQFSDAIVDYYYCKKMAYHFIKRSQQPVCLMMKEPEDGKICLMGSNEFTEDKIIRYSVKEVITDCVVASGEAIIKNFSTEPISYLPHNNTKTAFYLIEWEIDGIKCKNHYLCGNPPYSLNDYILWLKKADMFEIEEFNNY